MIFFVAVVNVFGVFTLWRYFKLLKQRFYDTCAILESEQKKRFKAECEAVAWQHQYHLLEGVLKSLRRVGFEANR